MLTSLSIINIMPMNGVLSGRDLIWIYFLKYVALLVLVIRLFSLRRLYILPGHRPEPGRPEL